MSDPIEATDLTDSASEPQATPEPEPQAETATEAPSAPRMRRSERPSQYAVVKTGGKQYRVSVGDTISVERMAAEAGSDVTLGEVLLVGGDGSTRVGTPTVTGVSVNARVDSHFRGEKIIVFKYKAKKRYRRRIGHRQELTTLTITGIAG